MQLDESTRLDPVPLIGTISTAGDTITSPMLDRGTLQANRYDGRLIKVAEDATALAFSPAVTITGVHTATTTTLTVSSTTDIRSGYLLILNASEMVLVRAVVSGTVLTVVRGVQGTTAAAYTGTETVQYEGLGYVTGVDDGGFAAGGILTISPNFPDTNQVSAGPYGAGAFYLYPKGLHPDYLIEKMQSVLKNTDHPYIWFPSLVPDSDFASNDITLWPDEGTPSSKVFSTTSAADRLIFGERYISWAGNSLGDGVRSPNFGVYEGEQLLIATWLFGGSAGDGSQVKLQTVESGTGTTIKTVGPIAEALTNIEVRFRKSMPDEAETARLVWEVVTASHTGGRILSPVIVQSDRRRYYNSPTWFTRPSQFKGSFFLPQGYTLADIADAYIPMTHLAQADYDIDFMRSERDAVPLRLGFACPGNEPIGIVVMRPFIELAGDSSTTVADKDYVALKTVSNILRDRKDNAWKHWAGRASNRAKMLGYGGRELQVREQLTYAGAT